MADRATTRCDDCGQADDHPKLHYGIETYHHDCLPPRVRHDVLGDGNHAVHKVVRAIVKECESGTKGLDLHAYIQDLHDGTESPAAKG